MPRSSARQAKAPKAAAAAAAVPLILTKPNKGGTAKKKDKLVISGYENLASKIRERQEELDSLTADQKADKEKLVGGCKVARRDAEIAGDFHKTCLVESSDGSPVLVAFQDKYSKVDVAHEDSLRTALNGQFDALFTRGLDVKAKSGITLEKLQEKLGDKFDVLASMLDLTEFLVADRDFMQKRATLRPSLDAGTNATIDVIVDQCQYAPMVKTK